METYQFFASAPKGIIPVLAGELKALGLDRVKQTWAGVSFTGTFESGYRACLWLRTANRVFLQIASFEADSASTLYDGIKNIDWSAHMMPDNTLAIDFNSDLAVIKHTHFGALKVKDAIVDQFREKYSIRPSIDTLTPDIRINVYMNGRLVTVSLDLSGESLHKRGYRSEKGLAPIKENLAAAILIKSGWPEIAERGGGFIDPMCGSGTLPIEAAMIAGQMAPGLLREQFGFMHWRQHQPDLWERLVSEAEEREIEHRQDIGPIIGYDRDPAAIKVAISNLERAGLHGLIHFEKRELSELIPHKKTIDNPGLIVVNPPYGERMGGDAYRLKDLYGLLGKRLRGHFLRWHAALFTGNPKLAELIKSTPERTDHLYNGSIPCELIQYNIPNEQAVDTAGRPEAVNQPGSVHTPSDEVGMFINRVKKNLRRLASWRKANNVTCFRAYDKDVPEYAVAIDVYEKWIHVQEYRSPDTIPYDVAQKRLNDILAVIPSIFNLPHENVFLKQRKVQKQLNQYEKHTEEGKKVLIDEAGLKFEIDLKSYIDTGLFLDHRMTRAMIGCMAAGRRFLNLFSYTGTATVYASRGGANTTTSVDKSNTYTRWAKKNMAINGFDNKNHSFYSADCLSWMQHEKSMYDLIFLDPPTFSNTKKADLNLDIQKDHVEMIKAAVNLLADGGTIIFSNNFRRFKMDHAALKDLLIEDITASTIPPDFERNPKIHNCWLIRKRDNTSAAVKGR
ncbi:MAG: bifunctional 23S rRNA (guanine(2069)-N(7))-methyltransferase RlmK/23S rRNA (guanine(2445)-N(2))-methyltransferase RlmL [Deltaproteobacteria bacterium]|nr:bifunctional 23S rRNA (guanine(2069)-N(7))-methyltransferase RlmK/23S rRNA (guanine(2445)-N(2))-methyltransferase RlmL [Deltaproteobacteria bacterium]